MDIGRAKRGIALGALSLAVAEGDKHDPAHVEVLRLVVALGLPVVVGHSLLRPVQDVALEHLSGDQLPRSGPLGPVRIVVARSLLNH